MKLCFEYEQLDSWFFKENRPMDSLGNNEMQSLFPPTAYSFSGITRSFLGNQANLNWNTYRKGKGTEHQLDPSIDFCNLMGSPISKNPSAFGTLQFLGCFPSHQKKTLLPAPLSLMRTKQDIKTLIISKQAHLTDLGRVKLAEMPNGIRDAKPLDKTWLTIHAFEQILAGTTPKLNECHSNIVLNDPRLGIQRSQQTRNIISGQLYQTSHIRLNPEYGLQNYVDVDKRIVPTKKEGHLIRFGAEGRQAHVTLKENTLEIKAPSIPDNARGLILYFLTHANFNSQPYPQGFKLCKNTKGEHTWCGTLNGINITIESVISGKAVREGGWDLAKHQPKPSPELLPAGSCWYISSGQALTKVAKTLHMQFIGEETQLGRGLIACGVWN